MSYIAGTINFMFAFEAARRLFNGFLKIDVQQPTTAFVLFGGWFHAIVLTVAGDLYMRRKGSSKCSIHCCSCLEEALEITKCTMRKSGSVLSTIGIQQYCGRAGWIFRNVR